ncbi:hypothetical protein LTR36_000116 [Oleoguttula mirabilis]|uniref:Uncharacterized protein n=1 Tax=Oleoguttula mirabilis TaxID=1507867 RepID=A0AAV9JZP3_9PEZI|nr:hypothetical protein LTR36_000116 [Oleoguttula mirabilis]
MPPKKADNKGQDLTFVVTTNPLATSAADKKRVRSAAALKSWPERRKRAFEQIEDSAKGQSAFLVSKPEDGPSRKIAKLKQRPPSLTRNESTASSTSKLTKVPAVSATAVEAINAALPGSEIFVLPCVREKTPELPCQCWKCHPERSRALVQRWRREEVQFGGTGSVRGGVKRPGDLALLTPPSSPGMPPLVTDRADPFNCYPVPYRSWFDGILHHMLTVFAPRGWPALKITNDQGLKWEWFMTQHALAEPALFYVRLLFASGDLIRMNVLKPEVSYWLQAKAIQVINEALKDPKRGTSDPLILAVGRIALHESMYGDRHAANTFHRPAQQRMIQLRGGMRALEFPELVKRLMRWADTVMSKQGSTERFLEDDIATENFSMNESVNVLEKWVPREGQELRKKIRISDLVND